MEKEYGPRIDGVTKVSKKVSSCRYCGKRHQTIKAAWKCQDRYERDYDELAELEKNDQRNWPENRRLMFLLMVQEPWWED